MKEKKEKKEKAPLKERRWFQIATNKYLVVTLAFILIIFFIDRNNVIRWAGNYLEIIRQERIIRQYDRNIKKMDEKLKELSSNTDSLEKFAREQFYFQEKDEDLFIAE